MARPGANEILRTIVGLLMLANVGCFFYYFIVHRPSTNLVLQAQLSTLARLKEATGHEHVNDTIKHAVKGWNVDDAAVVHNPSIGAAYYQAHGIDHVQLGIAGSPWWSMKRSEEENAGGHLVDVPSGVVPFSGQYWLPWLVAHNLSTTTSARGPLLLPLRIRRDASSTSHHLILPSSLIVAATLNGTVPLLYHTHFHHPPKNIAAASGNNTSSHVDDDHISWFEEKGNNGDESAPPVDVALSAAVNQSYRFRRHIPRNRLVKILTSLYQMLDHPNADESIRKARMQRAFVVAVKALRPQIEGKDVLVYGTLTEPFVEIVMLAIGGARRVVNVDHAPYRTSDKRIVSLTPREFWRCVGRRQRHCPSYLPEGFHIPRSFPVVVAYSIVQHDGLGRFGDDLDAFGDVKLMWELRSLLSPDPHAMLLLGVPLGNDCVDFNRYRVYGRRRLPLLLLGFEVYQSHGFEIEVPEYAPGMSFGQSWAHDNRCLGDSQRVPVLVLQKHVARDASSDDTDAFAASTRRLPIAATRSWFRVPGLAGPYPLHT